MDTGNKSIFKYFGFSAICILALLPVFAFADRPSEAESRRVYSTYESDNLPTNQNDIGIWNALHMYQQLILSRGIVDMDRDEFIPTFMVESNKGTFDNIYNNPGSVTSGGVTYTITTTTPVGFTGSHDPTKSNFQIAPYECYGSGDKATADIKNYGGCGWKDLIALLNTAIKFMIYIAASLSTIAFAYAGFLYMTAFGQSGKIEQAHGIFSKTLTGIFFVLIAWLLVATILKVLGVKEAFSLLNISGVTSINP